MKLYTASALILAILSTASCSDDKDDPMVTPTVLKEWTVPMAAIHENPAPKDRKETGSAVMQLFSDNSLKYTLTVTNLSGNDHLVNAYLQTGDVITSGPIVLPFESTFNGST